MSSSDELERRLEALRKENAELLLQNKKDKDKFEKENAELQLQNKKYKDKLDPTDYSSFLRLCHHKLFLPMKINITEGMGSAPGETKVDNKYYPCFLKKWVVFPDLHDQYQNRLKTTFGDEKLFQSAAAVDAFRDWSLKHPLADEDDMRMFQFIAVHAGTREIINKYLELRRESVPGEVEQTDIPDAIEFLSSPYGLLAHGHEYAEDVENRGEIPAYVPSMTAASKYEMEASSHRDPGDHGPSPSKRKTQSTSYTRPKLYPDQWCFRVHRANRASQEEQGGHEERERVEVDFDSIGEVSENNVYIPILVVEYKAGHKLRAHTVKIALENVKSEHGLFFDVMQDLHHNKIPTDEHVKEFAGFQKNTAQVITQAFHYMVDFGLCYCYVTSGDAILLLHLRPEDPTTLYYHLSLPRVMVGGALDDNEGHLEQTALAVVSTLTLMALEEAPQTQRWKENAHTLLRQWDTPYPGMLEGKVDSNGSSFASNKPGKDDNDDSSNGSNDGSFHQPSNLPSQGQGETRRSARIKERNNTSSGSGSGSGGASTGAGAAIRNDIRRRTPYCTQNCLLGLRNGGPMDPACPNFDLHKAGAAAKLAETADKTVHLPHPLRHPLSTIEFMACMREQLSHDLDDDCEALDRYGKFGATSMLFRLTLRPFGYCLVAKGVQHADARGLLYELGLYNDPHMAAEMGRLIPVCLGFLGLVRPYIASTGARVTSMLLMSYCGEPMPNFVSHELAARIRDAWARLRQLGIEHNDERAPNVVWNAEMRQVMCIDFGKSYIRPRKQRPSSKSKSKQLQLQKTKKRTVDTPDQGARSPNHCRKATV